MLVVFLVGAVAASPKAVYAATIPAYESSIQIQNLDEVAVANISIAYYNPDGSLAVLPDPYTNPVTDTVQPGSSNTYLPIHPDVGFKGSVVVSSDKEIAIISNLTIAATNRALGTYTGVHKVEQQSIFHLSINVTMCLSSASRTRAALSLTT